ncbi:MAG: hypothetical protein ABIB11_06190 [Candidatus Omnitrophota bacterium]
MAYEEQQKWEDPIEMPVGIAKNPYERKLTGPIISTGGYRHAFRGCSACGDVNMESNTGLYLSLGLAAVLVYAFLKF